MKANPLDFCHQEETNYPSLSKLAVSALGIPVSSAAVERLFSIGGKIYQPDRCHLSDSRFEQLMFIRSNCDVVSYK